MSLSHTGRPILWDYWLYPIPTGCSRLVEVSFTLTIFQVLHLDLQNFVTLHSYHDPSVATLTTINIQQQPLSVLWEVLVTRQVILATESRHIVTIVAP